jgi:uncharacterized protein YbjT (DUF2867 family)
VRALTRDPARASLRLGDHVDVVGGDLGRPDSLTGALDGVDSVFLVFPSVVADAAARELITTIAIHARRIVYLSAHGVPDEPEPHAVPDGSIMGSHAHLDGLIAASGAEYAFLRASGFAANTLAWEGQLRQGDVLRWIYPQARRALVHEADLAAVAARGSARTASFASPTTSPARSSSPKPSSWQRSAPPSAERCGSRRSTRPTPRRRCSPACPPKPLPGSSARTRLS